LNDIRPCGEVLYQIYTMEYFKRDKNLMILKEIKNLMILKEIKKPYDF